MIHPSDPTDRPMLDVRGNRKRRVREQAESAHAETLERTASIQVYGMPAMRCLTSEASGWLGTFPHDQPAPSRRLHAAQSRLNQPADRPCSFLRESLRATSGRRKQRHKAIGSVNSRLFQVWSR